MQRRQPQYPLTAGPRLNDCDAALRQYLTENHGVDTLVFHCYPVAAIIDVRSSGKVVMPWYVYLAWFFAGVFLVNAIPHTVQGLSGNRFQTPFGSPPGVGESSASLNVVWGLANFAVGGGLLHVFFPPQLPPPWLLCIAGLTGAVAMGLRLSTHLGKVRNVPPHP